jgi:hypothetical protein
MRLTLREALGIVALVIAQAGKARPRFQHYRITALANCHIFTQRFPSASGSLSH